KLEATKRTRSRVTRRRCAHGSLLLPRLRVGRRFLRIQPCADLGRESRSAETQDLLFQTIVPPPHADIAGLLICSLGIPAERHNPHKADHGPGPVRSAFA